MLQIVTKPKIIKIRINEKAQQIEKWEKQALMNYQNIFFGETSYEKYQKAKNVEQSILMNAQNILMIPFLFKENVLLSPILKALLSNKNGILHFWKNQ